jgi:predicted Zn finger-like uncharacterized protein
MKLICPKCQAQYEIPDVAIPDIGRDVQCANCNETWFQAHPDAKAPSGPDAAVADPAPSDPKSSDPKPGDPPKSGDAPIAEPETPRRELSPAVTDILRQEAAREKEARAAKAKDQDPKSSQANARLGRDRLPEIADIDVNNPRLNPGPAVEETADTIFDVDTDLPVAVRKKGFKRGFSMIVLLMGMALLLYVLAPQLAQKYPNLLEPLSTYVNAVNSGRIWLNDLISGMMGKT